MTRTVATIRIAAALLAVSASASCSLLGGDDDGDGRPRPAAGDTGWDPSVSLTPAGERLAASAGLAEVAATYDVDARVWPRSGKVAGTVRLTLPVGDADTVRLRYFAGMPDFGADAAIGQVLVDGAPAKSSRDDALVTVDLPAAHEPRVGLRVPFTFQLPMNEGGGGLLDALGGMGGPTEVGLLSRRRDAWNLGHWFPLWIPEGGSSEPDPGGVGDIGNSPAALIRMRLTVPDGWTVVDGGVRTDEQRADGTVTVSSEGYGMNDLVVSLGRDLVTEERNLDGDLEGVVVRAHAPADREAELTEVLDETVTSLEVLSEHFADYPWREFDVVAAPLGSGVAGMEWPGATWIEPSLFAGGIPGLGELGDLLGGLEGLEGLGDLGALKDLTGGGTGAGLSALVGGVDGRMIETLRAWTIAHEVGHEWWHVIVGNDSVLAPVVDEPLAQYSACLVLRELEPGTARELDALCDAHIRSGYEQMRLLGDADGPASRSTGEFESPFQYAGLVYGKAAAFYRSLEDRYGRDAVSSALGAVTEEHAFDMLTADQLRAALAEQLDDPAFDRLWRRWMTGRHGDRDLGVDAGAGLGGMPGMKGREGLTGGDSAELDALLEELLGQLDEMDRPGVGG